MLNRKISLASLVTVTALLAACGGPRRSTMTVTDPPPADEPAPVVEADPEDVHIEGDHVTIDGHINFELDSDSILDDSSELLDHIALLLSHHGDEIQHLRVIGHTDAAGGHEHNQELSERRAAAVETALRERGVSVELEHSGVGETVPLCEEDTDECHASNRRVEFLIVSETGGGEAEPN